MRILEPELMVRLGSELTPAMRYVELTAPGDIRPAEFSFFERDLLNESIRSVLGEVAQAMEGQASGELSTAVEAALAGNNRALYTIRMPQGGYQPHIHKNTGGGALFYKGSGEVRLGTTTVHLNTGNFIRFPRGVVHGFVRLDEPSEVLAWQERGIVLPDGTWDFVIEK